MSIPPISPQKIQKPFKEGETHPPSSSPKTPPPSSRKITVESPETPTNRVQGVAKSYLLPCPYHSPGFIEKNIKPDAKPSKAFRKFEGNLEGGKEYNSLVFDSAKKDPTRIRTDKIQPDETGLFRIKSSSSDAIRLWRMHEPKPDGNARLVPLKSEDNKILPLKGSQLLSLIHSYKKNNPSSSTFENYVLNSTEKISKKRPLPQASESDDDDK